MTSQSEPTRMIDVFADISCPFAHFSLRRFVDRRRVAGAHHVRLRVRAWPLELVNGEPLTAAKVTEEIADLRAQVASDLFMGFDPCAFPSSTIGLLGTATLAYGQDVGRGEAFSLGVRDALFEHGEAIGEPDVIARLAGRNAVAVPDLATARAAVERDHADGRRRGVLGSPHFFVDGDPYFCPTLDIERRGDHLRIEIDERRLDEFIDRALR